MKFFGFGYFMAKIPAEYLPKIEQSIAHAVQVLSDPSSTSESYAAIAEELAEIQKSVGRGAAKAWRREVSARLKADWIKAGHDGIELERHVTPKITKVLELAEKIRKIAQMSLVEMAGGTVLVVAITAGLLAITIGTGRFTKDIINYIFSNEKPTQVAQSQQPQKDTSSNPPDPMEPMEVPPDLSHSEPGEPQEPDKAKSIQTDIDERSRNILEESTRSGRVEREAREVRRRSEVRTLFSSRLPQLKEFSITACRAPEQISTDSFFSDFSTVSLGENDDRIARELVSGMEDCAQQLFYQLIKMVRSRQSMYVDRQWIKTRVASFSHAQDTSPVDAGPPSHGSGRDCFRDGDPFGCQPKHR